MSRQKKSSIINGISSIFDITGFVTVDINLNETASDLRKKYYRGLSSDEASYLKDMVSAYDEVSGKLNEQTQSRPETRKSQK